MKIPHFTKQDYSDLLALLDKDHDFPKTYDEWLTKVFSRGEEAINPNDFVKWCKIKNQRTDVAALREYTNLSKGKRLVSENTTTFEWEK